MVYQTAFAVFTLSRPTGHGTLAPMEDVDQSKLRMMMQQSEMDGPSSSRLVPKRKRAPFTVAEMFDGRKDADTWKQVDLELKGGT